MVSFQNENHCSGIIVFFSPGPLFLQDTQHCAEVTGFHVNNLAVADSSKLFTPTCVTFYQHRMLLISLDINWNLNSV